jgi:hypothetical protein
VRVGSELPAGGCRDAARRRCELEPRQRADRPVEIASTTPPIAIAPPAAIIDTAILPWSTALSRSRRSSGWLARSASQPVAHTVAKSLWNASIWLRPAR